MCAPKLLFIFELLINNMFCAYAHNQEEKLLSPELFCQLPEFSELGKSYVFPILNAAIYLCS